MTVRRSALIITTIALILLALVPAVSANVIIYDRELHEHIDTSKSGLTTWNDGSLYYETKITDITFKDITKAQTLSYLVFEIPGDVGWWDYYGQDKIKEGRHDFTYTFNGADRPGVLYLNRKSNLLGQVTSTQFTIFLNEWDISGLTGRQTVTMPFYFWRGNYWSNANVNSETNAYIPYALDNGGLPNQIKVTEVTGIVWKHHIKVEEDLTSYYVYINGFIDDYRYIAQVIFSKDGDVFTNITNKGDEIYRAFVKDEINLVEIISPSGTEYAYPIYSLLDDSPEPVEFRPFDINGNVPLNDVQITVYICDPVTFEPGSVVDTFIVDYGDIRSLPRGYYCVEASLINYEQVYPIYETRFSNVNGPAIALIPMEREGVIDPTQPVLRTGSVTMTDHNGTSITGFEVTAVNYYTGEEYTVSTETDVAVITLPMDRTVEIRNPQTGVYEEAPVGYYTFYGQKPGYKMLLEEGIKVSVLPEKYDSYKLCNILVTSDTGPLTGKHQFQLRSWSDNSILQTGTISAKSATTGIWYNATVTNGIATLILPYDTSDALSEHAGQYYVYATSPGYEDIDYGVQITVYPRTIYEVRSIHLYPIGGVPPPGNVTLRIQVISETGQAVPNAEIFIAGVYGEGKDVWDTYTTSWTGFLEVSVPDNSIYDIVACAAGYYDSSQRIDLFIQDPTIIEIRLYLSGAPTVEPTTEPTGWVTGPPATQPTGGIPDEDDGSGGFLMESVRGIGNIFGVGFATAKIILGMLLALSIGFATAKQLRGGAAEFGIGLLGGTMLGILIGLIPVWTIVVLMLVVGLYIGYRYVGGANNG